MRQEVHVTEESELEGALRRIGLDRPRPTIVVVGGAGGLDDRERARVRPLFTEAIAPAAERLNAYVVDGGTDSGVMRLIGAARSAIGARFPLIGVVAEDTVELTGREASPDASPVEPHHTHLVVVPGHEWGDEGPWLARVAGILSEGHGSVTVLVNGGDLALADVGHSVAAGRRVVVVAGSGRVAEELAAAMRREPVEDKVGALAASDLVMSVDGLHGVQPLVDAIDAALGPKG